jgi:hypothetical protein
MGITTPTSAKVTTPPNNAANQTKSCLHQLIQFRQPIKFAIQLALVQKSEPIRHACTDSCMAECGLAPPSIQTQFTQVNQSHLLRMAWLGIPNVSQVLDRRSPGWLGTRKTQWASEFCVV